MELLYLFIKDYSKFKNQNINFGSEFIFNYSVEQQQLDVEPNNLFIPNFFQSDESDEAEVLNVSSVIGENGTGKTSLLKLISENFPSGFNLNMPMIFITKESGTITVNYTEEFVIKNDLEVYGFTTNKIDLRKEKLNGDGFNKDDFITFGYDLRGLNKTNFIYFSNVFDLSSGINVKDFFDISTNYLVYGDYNYNLENSIIQRNVKNENPLRNFMLNDVFRQVKFIHKFYQSKLIQFELPNRLNIEIKNNFLQIGINDKSLQQKIVFNGIERLISNLKKAEKKQSNTELEKIKFRLIGNIYLSFIVDFLLSYQSANEFLETKTLINDQTDININEIIKTLETFRNHYRKHINLDDTINKIGSLISLIEFIWQIDNSNDSISFENDSLILDIGKENSKTFNHFFNLYTQSYFIRPFFDITWGGMSSGERALLNIYSRFYSLTEQFGYELDEHLIILIDEGDLYLHPAWQKRFVKLMLDYLPKIYNKNKKGKKRTIQIIFTTNSPIPASDLLSYNTIFLENVQNENGETLTIVKDSLNDQKETFAANIHTLLSDSFFVKNGLIGDFASEKLNLLIDRLIKRVELSLEEKENIRRLIHQIGEPVLKHKLMQIYNDRFNLDIHERLDKIENHLGLRK
jgi:hypothetical protein